MSGWTSVAILVLLAVILFRVERIHEYVRAIDARTAPDDDDSSD